MKRFVLALLLPFFTSTLLFPLPLDGTSSSSFGMGSAGLALNKDPDSFYANPALLALGSASDISLIVSSSYQDDVVSSNFSSKLVNPLLENPGAAVCATFLSGNIAFSLQNQTDLIDRTENSVQTSYKGLNTTLFQLDWAGSLPPIAFGMNLRASAVSQRSPVVVSADQTFTDYLVETTLGRYESVDSLSVIELGLGLLVDYDWFKMGVVSNRVAFAQADEAMVVSIDSMLNSLDWGFSFSTPTYDADNQLHFLKAEAALDLVNLGSDADRQLRSGLALKLQLLPTWSISLMNGYKETKSTPSDLLKLDFDSGLHTISLGAQMNAFELNIACSIPTAWYIGHAAATDSWKFSLLWSLAL